MTSREGYPTRYRAQRLVEEAPRVPDVRAENHGSIWLLRPLTPKAHEFLDVSAHFADDAQWFGGALVVEPRYVEDILVGMIEQGLEIE